MTDTNKPRTAPDLSLGPTRSEIYAQQSEHLRTLHDNLYRMPPVFSTIIGGLWFFAAQQIQSEPLVAAGVFLFAGLASFLFCLAFDRYRLAHKEYNASVMRLEGDLQVLLVPPKIRTTDAFAWLMWAAIVLSLAGFAYALLGIDRPADVQHTVSITITR